MSPSGRDGRVKSKLFMRTLVVTMMDWFISLPDGHVTSFPQLSKLFRAQYIANRAPPSISYDLFDIRQYQGVFEGIPPPLWSPGSEVEPQGRKDDGACVQEGH